MTTTTTEPWRCFLCGRPLEHRPVLGPARKHARRRTVERPGLVCPRDGALAYIGPEPAKWDRDHS